jgi:hypothetical protein
LKKKCYKAVKCFQAALKHGAYLNGDMHGMYGQSLSMTKSSKEEAIHHLRIAVNCNTANKGLWNTNLSCVFGKSGNKHIEALASD